MLQNRLLYTYNNNNNNNNNNNQRYDVYHCIKTNK